MKARRALAAAVRTGAWAAFCLALLASTRGRPDAVDALLLSFVVVALPVMASDSPLAAALKRYARRLDAGRRRAPEPFRPKRY
ncbi:MAG TPA: hypothetical protein VLA56_21200 [Pseudomonadales bacterium]|nr:hypothetical protein [Pseudomonadales bacterium]